MLVISEREIVIWGISGDDETFEILLESIDNLIPHELPSSYS